MNEIFPDVNRIGLNIEVKIPDQYKEEFGIDVNERLWNILEKFDLHLKENAARTLPIIIQSFDISTMNYFR